MGKTLYKQNWAIILYYALLLFLLVSRPAGAHAPNLLIRIGYMALLMIPGFFLKNAWMPAIMTCFVTVAQYGFSYSYLPSGIEYFVVPLLVGIILLGNNAHVVKLPNSFKILLLLFFLVELVATGRIGITFWGSFVALLVTCYIDDRIIAEEKMSWAFIIASFTLSLLYILFRDQFLVDYDYKSGLERADWVDPNYFSLAIGMGAVVALSRISEETASLIEKIFYLVTFILSFFSVVLLASRGGLFSLGVSTLFILLFSRRNGLLKIFWVVAAFFFVLFLYKNNYFDLVIYRFENDVGGGSGRIDIWADKLRVFKNLNIGKILFGCGPTIGATITGALIGFHNDFLAMLVEYGIVGFLFFISLWYYPIRNVLNHKERIPHVFAFILFLIIGCFSLEPLSLGRIPFWLFLIYIIIISK